MTNEEVAASLLIILEEQDLIGKKEAHNLKIDFTEALNAKDAAPAILKFQGGLLMPVIPNEVFTGPQVIIPRGYYDQLKELEAKLQTAKTALEQIARVKYGLELTDTDEYRLEHWSKQALGYEALSRQALAQLEGVSHE